VAALADAREALYYAAASAPQEPREKMDTAITTCTNNMFGPLVGTGSVMSEGEHAHAYHGLHYFPVQNGKQALPYGRASDAVIANERGLTEPRASASGRHTEVRLLHGK
jgi:hypothetical protein